MSERSFRHFLAWAIVVFVLGGFFVIFAGPM